MLDPARRNSVPPLLSRPFPRSTLPREFADLDTALAILPDPRFLLQIDLPTTPCEPAELLEAARDHLLIWNAFWRKLLRLRLCAADGMQPRTYKAYIGPGRKKMRNGDFSDRGDHLALVRCAFAATCAEFGDRLLRTFVRCDTPEQALSAVRLRLFGFALTQRKRNLFGIKSHGDKQQTHISPLPECHVAKLALPFHFSERRGPGAWAPRKARAAHDAMIQRVATCADLTRRPLSDGAQKSLLQLTITLYRIQRRRTGPRPALDRRRVRIRVIPRVLSIFEQILAEEFGAAPPPVINVVPSEHELLALLKRRIPTLEITNRRIARPVAPPRPKRDPFSIIRPDRALLPATVATLALPVPRRPSKSAAVTPKTPVSTPPAATIRTANPQLPPASRPAAGAPGTSEARLQAHDPSSRQKTPLLRPPRERRPSRPAKRRNNSAPNTPIRQRRTKSKSAHRPPRPTRPAKVAKISRNASAQSDRLAALSALNNNPDLTNVQLAKIVGRPKAFFSRPAQFVAQLKRMRAVTTRPPRRAIGTDPRTGNPIVPADDE